MEIATIGAMLEDFDFDLNLAVSGFKFKVPGQPTVSVNGNKLNGMAKTALRELKEAMLFRFSISKLILPITKATS